MELPQIKNDQTVQLNSGTDQVETISLPPQFFNVDPTALDADLCSLGRLMMHYGEIEAKLGAEVARREARLKELDGELDLSIRANSASSGERMTEGRIEAMRVTSPSRKQMIELLVLSQQNHNMIRWAMRVLQGKKDILIALTYREKEMIKSDRYY